jgi:hypothetical protein
MMRTGRWWVRGRTEEGRTRSRRKSTGWEKHLQGLHIYEWLHRGKDPTAPIPHAQIGKTPQVAHANSIADTRERELDLTRPVPAHFVFIPRVGCVGIRLEWFLKRIIYEGRQPIMKV